MQQFEVSHQDIYDRLAKVESKVDRIDKNTSDVVEAFNAAAGAFKVLEWLAKLAKPVLWIGAMIGAMSVMWSNWKAH